MPDCLKLQDYNLEAHLLKCSMLIIKARSFPRPPPRDWIMFLDENL